MAGRKGRELLLILVAVTASLGAGCAKTAATRCDVTKGSGDATPKARTLTYADGSGNAYVLDGPRLEYVPVTPERSSSGTYSGGAPFSRELSSQDLADLTRAIDAAIEAKASHVERRGMMSGLVTLQCGDDHQRWVLAPGCAEQRAIEAVLARLKPKPGE